MNNTEVIAALELVLEDLERMTFDVEGLIREMKANV